MYFILDSTLLFSELFLILDRNLLAYIGNNLGLIQLLIAVGLIVRD